MKSSLICVLCCLVMTLTACNEHETAQPVNHVSTSVKTVDQLNEDEKGGLDDLTKRIYKEVGAQLLYTTTFYFMPSEEGSPGKELKTPLVLLSGASMGHHMLEENTLTAIKYKVQNKAIGWKKDGKEYTLFILEGYLVKNPGGAGGSMYTSNDMVTIVPTKIQIDETIAKIQIDEN